MIDFIAIVLIFLLVYPFAIYPLVLAISSFLFAKPLWFDLTYEPEITILISAFNEEEYIIDCLNSIMEVDYPKDKIIVLVGSDGSTDRTNAILEEYKSSNKLNLDYFVFDRLGKNKVINELVDKVKTEFTFFLDADCRLTQNLFSETVRYLINDELGAIMMSIKFFQNSMDANTGSKGEKYYQKFENYLRLKESAISTVANALGIYFIRTSLIKKIENQDLADDTYQLLQVGKTGKRVIYIDTTYIYEVRDRTLMGELNRRARTFSSGLYTLLKLNLGFNFNYNWLSFFVFSHKMIRYFTPIIIILLVINSMFMTQTTIIGGFTIYSLIVFFGLAGVGYFLSKFKMSNFIFQAPLFFLTLMLGYIFGFQKFLSGNYSSKWSHSVK